MAKIISEIGHQLIPFPQCRPATLRRPTGIRCSVFATPSHEVNASGARVVPWGSEIESLESASALKNWLSASGLPPQKLEIRRVDVGERGLVALKNIRKGEKLLFVPPSLVITADSVWSCPEVGNVLKKNSVPDWPLLATYLISEASFKSSSRWSSYITALPRQPYSLLYWTLTELDTYLVASQIRERAIERITNVIGTYEDLRLRIFSKHQDLFPEEVRLPSMDGKVALVPWADMLNHSPEVETFLDYDKSSKGIVFMADQSYQLGEQVFISYGKKSNGELLLSYGFVPKDGTNPNDSVELSLSLKKSDKCYKEKLEALRKYGLQVPQRFPLQITGWPVEMMAYSYLVVSPPNMRQYFEEMAAAASSRAASETGRKYPELEEQALQYLLDCCESSISKYSKFLQDGDTLNSGQLSAKQADRKSLLKKLATDLCTSEQRILFRAQYILRRRLQDMRNGELRALTILNGFRKLFK
ncbi:ribulose-1,5 bisphosphate carboxylase/oxygenase large subunit N-methyltransferase, chloroplastic-like isoform X3 [Zingiber officinale]|uniref:ribulose-1,5 bisphosphate carboxylase/oxygenase large subunit N-methyltransferase, chloroplastic-like isoform X3 n=1 Tax=Zingiber officinale TaxID=94328 RepID=UPI001C4BE125|nr:ribulose-1,5 bisphosphate carboxylase/oxygenase large subunit N-methyltransferase, chloroplastic-like isoform X3 [Zingiber officinale]